jgi:hypothetical protein
MTAPISVRPNGPGTSSSRAGSRATGAQQRYGDDGAQRLSHDCPPNEGLPQHCGIPPTRTSKFRTKLWITSDIRQHPARQSKLPRYNRLMDKAEVLVIGAGAAGLAAARDLSQAGAGSSFSRPGTAGEAGFFTSAPPLARPRGARSRVRPSARRRPRWRAPAPRAWPWRPARPARVGEGGAAAAPRATCGRASTSVRRRISKRGADVSVADFLARHACPGSAKQVARMMVEGYHAAARRPDERPGARRPGPRRPARESHRQTRLVAVTTACSGGCAPASIPRA